MCNKTKDLHFVVTNTWYIPQCKKQNIAYNAIIPGCL